MEQCDSRDMAGALVDVSSGNEIYPEPLAKSGVVLKGGVGGRGSD